MVWRKAMGTRAARARLQNNQLVDVPIPREPGLKTINCCPQATNLYILKFSLVTVGTAESEISGNKIKMFF